MVYLNGFSLPDEDAENSYFWKEEVRTCIGSAYPFRLFPGKGLENIRFSDITVFYGGNGSGKTTLLNVIGEKLGASRLSIYNSSARFPDYLKRCREDLDFRIPRGAQFLSSDDVFDYLINMRHVNRGIDDRRVELFSEYDKLKKAAENEHGELNLHGFEDYERWKAVRETQKNTQSRYVRTRLSENVSTESNGETAMRYFVDRIDRDALYLIDEPENSLSVKFQIELARYISDSARFYKSQFIIASHSPIILSIPGALIYDLDVYPVETRAWTELENVRRYYDFFMEHREEFDRE